MRARLQALGIDWLEAPVPGLPVHQLFLRDPVGLQIELSFDACELSRPALPPVRGPTEPALAHVAYLELRGIAKRFGEVEVVAEMDLAAEPGEFIVLVGASGCGKSTTLRMIAGLEAPSQGRIVIDGRDVTQSTPADRDIAMVFQNYALYPHMDVAQNMSFALELAGTPRERIAERVQAAAKVLNITYLLKRKPKELSGGQRQRVAMGRAIVQSPRSSCSTNRCPTDAKLRGHMRIEIALMPPPGKTTGT